MQDESMDGGMDPEANGGVDGATGGGNNGQSEANKKARDKNGDGMLNFQEYIGERGEGKDREWLLTEKDRSAIGVLVI